MFLNLPQISVTLGLLMAVALVPVASSQIRTDGSLGGGAAQSLAGPNYLIPQQLGRLAGPNLFHSFARFNLGAGETARFTTAAPGIANVISRVTGGQASSLDGALILQAASGNPAFFLINPAGITFGPNARIDVPGAFHVATADSLKFPDGRFFADPALTSTFSSAHPEAFGFLGNHAASIVLTGGADLVTRPGATASLTAGSLNIDRARLRSEGGTIRLAAVGAQALDVPLLGDLPTASGRLTLRDAGRATVSAACCGHGGRIEVAAGTVLIDGAGDTTGSTGLFGSAAGGSGGSATITVRASEAVTLRDNGLIYALSGTAAAAGQVVIDSPRILIDDAQIAVVALGSGDAGRIALRGARIELRHGGQLWANAEGNGDGGDVSLVASEAIEIGQRNAAGDRSDIVIQTAGAAQAGRVELIAPRVRLYDDGRVMGYSGGSAAAGTILVRASDLILENGGVLYTFGLETRGGRVTVEASRSVRIVGKDEARSANPGADMVSTGIIGHATSVQVTAPDISIAHGGAIRAEDWYQDIPGSVTIDTQRLRMESGGHISTDALGHSFTDGRGGHIVIRAGESVSVSGGSNGRASSISSGSRAAGDAGWIEIAAPLLRVADNAFISTGTGRFGEARAGRIEIAAQRVELLAGGRLASIEFGHTAAGGHINVLASEAILIDGGSIIAYGLNEAAAGRLLLVAPDIALHGGLISAYTDESALAGGIEIRADRLRLAADSRIESNSEGRHGAGDIAIYIVDLLSLDHSAITTTSLSADGGNIRIAGATPDSRAGAIVLRDSLLTTSVLGYSGDGGNIELAAGALVLDGGFIQANTTAAQARGGDIRIDAPVLVASHASLRLGGDTELSFRPGIAGHNVIQAAAPTGISGNIALRAPALDFSGALVDLGAGLASAPALGRSPCAGGGSSLSLSGRGGLPAEPWCRLDRTP